MRSRFILLILLLCLCLPLTPLDAQPLRRTGAKITNGVTDTLHPTVGLFITDGECSATLIGCQTVLTAAHCICGDHLGGPACAARPDLVTPTGKFVFFQHAGLFAVSSVAVDPAYNAHSGVSDVAILHLAAQVTNIAPSPLNRIGSPPLGLPGEIVGYGSTQTESTDDGIKRRGFVTTAACDPAAAGFVCWNFKRPLGAPGTNSDTCFGDSGGPLFLSLGGRTVLAGVTSSGTNSECAPVDNSFDDDVFSDLAWIDSQGGADLSATTCGPGPQIGGPGTTVLGSDLALSNSHNQVTTTVEVLVGTAELRVALNSADWFDNSNALYIRHGAPASTTTFDCKGDAPSGQQYCRVQNPAAGTWNILASHLVGPGGGIQVTASLISQPAVPSPCVPGPNTLCLNDGRFKVEGTYQTPDGQSGPAKVVKLTDEAGYFWFFSDSNVEAVIKVLNGCPVDQSYWVFAGGLTNVQTTVTVTDSTTGFAKTYSNPQGAAFQPIQDTAAFPACP
ncbi:MAG TPA: trypsin-like serine protease [Thermoanaerobaculia bacterium]|nr:trypsin-like serine protease [Thermoanaerobaculia bacterium]